MNCIFAPLQTFRAAARSVAASSLAFTICCAMLLSGAAGQAVFTGGNGIASFGVANYGGGPNFGAPTYILNNFTGLFDVMTSPAGGFQTANTSIVNNIASYGPGALPGGAFHIGGGNGNGLFGQGAIAMNGPNVGYSLRDINPDGAGAAAYTIGSWSANFVQVGNFAGNFGSWLAVRGRLTSVLSAAAVSLRTRISGGPFGAGVDLPQLVLAASGNGNFQALGGPGGGNAAMLINLVNGQFRGLAVNNLGPVAIANGTVLNVTSTLTAIADPAEFESYSTPEADLLALTGPLPDWSATSISNIPEPTAGGLLLVIGLFVAGARRKLA